jgi:hypothetical protein
MCHLKTAEAWKTLDAIFLARKINTQFEIFGGNIFFRSPASNHFSPDLGNTCFDVTGHNNSRWPTAGKAANVLREGTIEQNYNYNYSVHFLQQNTPNDEFFCTQFLQLDNSL